jgi:hypothetical protein
MHTSEILADQWTSFLDHLSEQYRGDRVCVQVMRQDTGLCSEAVDLPLMGISNDYKASGGGRIEVMAGDSPRRHITHSVFCPKHLSIVESDNGEPMTMRIEGGDGEITVVHFGSEPKVDRKLM